MVPEPPGQAEARHGGAQEGRPDREPPAGGPAPQDLPRERPGPGDPQEEAPAQQPRRQVLSYLRRAIVIILVLRSFRVAFGI